MSSGVPLGALASGAAIANLKHLRPGDTLLLAYSGAPDLLVATLGEVDDADADLELLPGFAPCVAAVRGGSELERRLEEAGYMVRQGRSHNVLVLADVRGAPHGTSVQPPAGRNAIWRTPLPEGMS